MPAPEATPAPARPQRQTALAVALVVAVLAVGALLRFNAIGRKSLWLDEAVTLNLADAPYGEMIAAVVGHDAHPPGYYALLHPWMRGSHSAARARAFSAAASVATLAAFYLLARALLPQAAALMATALLAVSAYQVYFAQEARHYALAALFVTLSWCCLAQIVAGKRRHQWPFWLGIALSNAAALYTFYYCAFAIAAQLVVLLALWRQLGRRPVARWLAWQLLPAALFAPYVSVILEHAARLRSLAPPGGAPDAPALMATASQFACGFLARLAGHYPGVALAGSATLGLLAVAAGLAAWRAHGRALAVGLAWLLAPVLLLALFPLRGHAYDPKHLLIAAPALALLPAAAFASARGLLRWAVAALAAALVAANAYSLVRYYDRGVEKENWRAAVAEVVQRVEPGDIVVFNPFYVRHPFHYYYRPHYRDFPVVTVEAPVAGRPFRAGELKLGRRLWVLEGASPVEVPNPEVNRALSGYPLLMPVRRYEGLIGTVSVYLYDTLRPAKPPR